jgi:hypothetical protein
MNLLLALDPGYKANHWFIFICKERSPCSQNKFAGEGADLKSDTE